MKISTVYLLDICPFRTEVLVQTKVQFIVSAVSQGFMENKYWDRFKLLDLFENPGRFSNNSITKAYFYHSGGKIENRNRIVEAWIFNFEIKIPAACGGDFYFVSYYLW
ncbi:hypothetical protein Holit_01998 [Hollandina sp. SP2]